MEKIIENDMIYGKNKKEWARCFWKCEYKISRKEKKTFRHHHEDFGGGGGLV